MKKARVQSESETKIRPKSALKFIGFGADDDVLFLHRITKRLRISSRLRQKSEKKLYTDSKYSSFKSLIDKFYTFYDSFFFLFWFSYPKHMIASHTKKYS